MPSKLCPHSLGDHPDVRLLAEAGCRGVKLAGRLDIAADLLTARPDLILFGRVDSPYDPLAAQRAGVEPEAAVREFVAGQQEQYRRNPLIRIWEGPAMPGLSDSSDPANMLAMAWYAAFEAERLRLLADIDLRGVAGNFTTGAPDLDLWLAFFPALDAADRYDGFLGLQEYTSPWMWWLTGDYQMANCEGRPDFRGEGDTGWLTLRYRKVYRDYLDPNGFGRVPLLITECGLARVDRVCPGQSDGSWRDHLDFWSQHDGARDPIDYWRGAQNGAERDPERYYAEQLIWYDRELQKDDYVVGAAVFTFAADESRKPYDLAGTRVTQYLADHIHAERLADEAMPKVVEIAPEPTPALVEAVAAMAASPAPAAMPAHVETLAVPPGPEAARAARQGNLLVNGSFEAGAAYFHDDTRELAVPVDWQFSFYGETAPIESKQTAPWGRPITALINSRSVTPSDRARVFAGGAYAWKICGTNSPVWVRLYQAVAGLKPGQKYRLTVSLLPDLIVRTHPRRAYAGDPLAGEVRLMANFTNLIFDSGWKNGREAPAGRYTQISLEFVAPGSRLEAAVEVRGRWPLPMGAWYIDEFSLAAV